MTKTCRTKSFAWDTGSQDFIFHRIGKPSTELFGEAFKNQHASLAAGVGGRGDL